MKDLKYIVSSFVVLSALDAHGKFEPISFAGIEPEAIEEAESYDGAKLLFGVGYSAINHKASLTDFNRSTETKKNLNHMSGVIGLDYSKKVAENWMLGASLVLDLWKRKKNRGSWDSLNQDYASARGGSHPGTQVAEIQNSFFEPELNFKGGYIFKPLKTTVCLKVGVQRIDAKYKYFTNGHQVASASAENWLPLIGISGFRKINDKYSVGLEISKTIKRQSKKYSDNVQHKIKSDAFTIRLLGSMAMPK